MFNQHHIIVLLTLEEDSAVAVEKAAIIASATQSTLTLLTCAYDGALNTRYKNAEHARDAFLSKRLDGLDTLAQIPRSKGVEVSTEAVWEKHASTGLRTYLANNPADLVIKATHHQSAIQRSFFSQTDWELIRNCAAPLLLCKAARWPDSPTVTAAVDPVAHADRDQGEGEDDKIIFCAQRFSEVLNGTTELLHIYDPTPMMVYLDQAAFSSVDVDDGLRGQHRSALNKLAAHHGYDQDHVKLEMGSPVQAMPDYLHNNDIDVVVMGAASRKGIERWLLGHTAEKVLDKISIDILIAG